MRAVVVLLCVSVVGGCAFGTNYVSLPAPVMVAAPQQGERLSVQVRDARGEVSGAEIGFKRNGYGAKTGSIELAGKEPLADRLTRDLVGLLRERGYQAQPWGGDGGELVVGAEVSAFLIDHKLGAFSAEVQGNAVLRLRVAHAPTGRVLWEDLIRAEYAKPGIMAVTESDHQEVGAALYAALLGKVRAALPTALATVTRPRAAR